MQVSRHVTFDDIVTIVEFHRRRCVVDEIVVVWHILTSKAVCDVIALTRRSATLIQQRSRTLCAKKWPGCIREF